MLRKKELLVVLMLVTLCFSMVWADETKFRAVKVLNPQAGEIVTRQVPVTPKQSNPYGDTSVLVEAFVVRVSTEALTELGINPIGQVPEGISIIKILACLDDPEKAEVISGAKVMASHNQTSKVSCEDTIYLKHEQDFTISPEAVKVTRTEVEIHPYESGKTLAVEPRIQPDGNIRVEATFSYLGIIENEDSMIPPNRIAYDWSGVLFMKSGTPVIAGASQNNDTLTFLILTATTQDSENTKKK